MAKCNLWPCMENTDVFMTFYGLKFLLLNLKRFMTFYDSAETLFNERMYVNVVNACKRVRVYAHVKISVCISCDLYALSHCECVQWVRKMEQLLISASEGRKNFFFWTRAIHFCYFCLSSWNGKLSVSGRIECYWSPTDEGSSHDWTGQSDWIFK